MIKEKDPNRFYVYLHRRKDNNEVFYIGKGCGDRIGSKQNRNRWWKHVVAKYGFTYEYVEKCLSEQSALELERELIKFYRETGHELCNISEGAGGPSGIPCPEEKKKALSERPQKHVICSNGMIFKQIKHAAKWISENTNFKTPNPCHIGAVCRGTRGHAFGYRWRHFIDGKIVNEDGLWEPVESFTGVYCSNGMVFESRQTVEEWLKENGFPLAQSKPVLRCCRGKRLSAYGFQWSFEDIFRDGA